MRYHASMTFDALLPARLVLALTGEPGTTSGTDTPPCGGAMSRRWKSGGDSNLGISDPLREFEPLAGAESEATRPHGAASGCGVDRAVTASACRQPEDGDDALFQALRWGATWRS